jgi:hypothetical protein
VAKAEAWAASLVQPPKPRRSEIRRFVSKRQPWWRDGREHPEHLFIPDTQVRPGVPIEHIRWAAEYAVERKPDVIVTGNDWWDFPSLNGHESEFADYRIRDFVADICSGLHAWDMFMSTIRKAKGYDPLILFVAGNHDQRFDRMFQYDRRLQRALRGPRRIVASYPGVVWMEPEEIVCADDVYYAHYFTQPLTGKPIGGTALNKLTKLKFTFSMGHVQVKETAEQHLANGRVIRGLVAGAFYQHEEEYKGQGNRHWRGIVYKHEVRDGDYDLMEVSMGYLRRRYGGKRVLADPKWREDEYATGDE